MSSRSSKEPDVIGRHALLYASRIFAQVNTPAATHRRAPRKWQTGGKRTPEMKTGARVASSLTEQEAFALTSRW